MMLDLNPNAEDVFISAVTASRDVIEVAKLSLPAVRDFFQKIIGALHISFDGWTAANVLSFQGITVHWTSEGTMKCTELDFIRCVFCFMHFLGSSVPR
jgi:hypothetical protein